MLRRLFDGELPAAILLDLDGTLIDSAPDLADLGFATAGEALTRCWVGNGAAMLVRRALAHAEGLAPEQVGATLQQQGLERFFVHYQAACAWRSELYPGVSAALAHWRRSGVPLACVTNKPARFTAPILEAYGLRDYFAAVICGDSLPQRKPDPAPLLHACEQMQVAPARSLMIGDSVNDVQAARSAGMAVIAVDYGYNHGRPIAQAEPDAVADSLAALID